jgi:hypothetical protein
MPLYTKEISPSQKDEYQCTQGEISENNLLQRLRQFKSCRADFRTWQKAPQIPEEGDRFFAACRKGGQET